MTIYARFRALWRDDPDPSTPVSAAFLNQLEDALVDASTLATNAAPATSVASAISGLTPLTDTRLTDARAPKGSAGGGLGGTYPNPTVTTVAAGAVGPLSAQDPTTTNARTPTAHAMTHANGGSDVLTPGAIGAATATALTTEVSRATNAEGAARTGAVSDVAALGYVLPAATTTFTGGDTFTGTAPAVVPLTVLGVAAQIGDLTDWKTSAGAVPLAVSSAGALYAPAVTGSPSLTFNSYASVGSADVSGMVRALGGLVQAGAGTSFSSLTATALNLSDGVNAGGMSLNLYSSGTAARFRLTRSLYVLPSGDTNLPSLAVRTVAGQTGSLLSLEDNGGTPLTKVAPSGLLDLSAVAATGAATGTSVGDKIALYGAGGNGFGIGVQSNRLVAFPSSTGAFAVRAAVATGAASSGTDAVVLGANGSVQQILAGTGPVGYVMTLAAGQSNDAIGVNNSAGTTVFKVGSAGALTGADGATLTRTAGVALSVQTLNATTTIFQVLDSTGTTVLSAGSTVTLGAPLRSATNNPPRFTVGNIFAGAGNVAGAALQLAAPASGSTDILQATDNGATTVLYSLTSAGLPRWNAAANAQTTVGAAGAASAPPATPTRYLKVVDSTGTTLVVPAYAAA